METENETINTTKKLINVPFEDFWNLYDKKRGDKNKLTKKWNALRNEDRDAIIKHLPKYKKSQPDKKFRKNPETYLNNKSWNDEIIGEEESKVNNDLKQYHELQQKNFAKFGS
jgi:hypothetical protein